MNLINQICEIKVAKGFKATVSTDGNIIVEKEEEKLIGYKLSGYVSKEIADIVMGRSDINMSGGDLYFIKGHIAGYYVKRAKDLGILDTWFIPVYEDDPNID